MKKVIVVDETSEDLLREMEHLTFHFMQHEFRVLGTCEDCGRSDTCLEAMEIEEGSCYAVEFCSKWIEKDLTHGGRYEKM